MICDLVHLNPRRSLWSLLFFGSLLITLGCDANVKNEESSTQASTMTPTAQSTMANIVETATVAPAVNLTSSCIPDGTFNPDADYFPDKAIVNYATGFSIEYHNSFKILTIKATDGTADQSFMLVQCGAPIPDANLPTITIPIESAFLSSTTQYPGFVELGSVAKIKGIGQAAYISSKEIICLLYTSPSPRDQRGSRMPSSA